MRKLIFLLPVLFFVQCSKTPEFQTLDSGVEYCHIKSHPDASVSKPGDVWDLNIKYYNSADSILFSSDDISSGYRIYAPKDSYVGSVEEGIFLMHEGDSSIFRVDADTFYKLSRKMKTPAFIKPNEKLTFYVKLKKITDGAEYQKVIDEYNSKQFSQELLMIRDYLEDNLPNYEKLESGVYKSLTKKGKGKQPVDSNTVTVHYIGRFMDGRQFDNSYERNEPFTFQLGAKKSVEGFESAILSMKKGEKSTFVIPSQLAYGAKGAGKIIPPFSTLIFDIELLDL